MFASTCVIIDTMHSAAETCLALGGTELAGDRILLSQRLQLICSRPPEFWEEGEAS